jgi:alpha-tubulin suppressor-like RCC1 family protein
VLIPKLSGIRSLSAGEGTAFVVLEGGTVKGWGTNTGATETKCVQPNKEARLCDTHPVTIKGLAGVVSVAAAGFGGANLALLQNGTVMSWGGNYYGQLGNGTFGGSRKTPELVPGLSGVVAVAADRWSDFALLEGGTVVAWGRNVRGELGNGGVGSAMCGGELCEPNPTPVTGLSGVKALAAGGEHALALMSDGTVKAWGTNALGELGDGTDEVKDMPVPVSGLAGVVAVAAGNTNSTALLGGGTVMDWGQNRGGELGVGTDVGPEECIGGKPAYCSTAPVAVTGITGVTAIAEGAYHTLALLAGGAIDSWGASEALALGTGAFGPEHCWENQIRNCSSSSVPVTGLNETTTPQLNASAIVAGGENSYAVGPTPKVTRVSPVTGPDEGGTVVTITGSGFTGATEVIFGVCPATDYAVNSDTSITATSPPCSGEGRIKVTTFGTGVGGINAIFSYHA